MKRGLIVLVALMAAAWFAVPANATTDPGTTGYIEVCKDSSTIAPGSATFQFTVGNLGSILVNAGECSPAMKVAAGTVRVHEDNYTDCRRLPHRRVDRGDRDPHDGARGDRPDAGRLPQPDRPVGRRDRECGD